MNFSSLALPELFLPVGIGRAPDYSRLVGARGRVTSWFIVVLVVMGLMPLGAWANPFASLKLLPSGETAMTGKTLFSLDSGDSVEPHFSPDARYLVFANEVAEGSLDLTEIQAVDLDNRRVKTLLDAKALREFAVYKSFVAGFTWVNSKTLIASISDGDVNGVDLVFDVESGKLIEKKPLSFSDNLPSLDEDMITKFTAAFPSVPPLVLENALMHGYRVGSNKYVVQKNYWKQDNHVWQLDAERKEMIKLIDIPDVWIYSLRGAFASGDAVILLMAYGQEAYLVRYVEGRLELLYRFDVKNYQQTRLRVEHQVGDKVLFQVVTGAGYEKRKNSFFVYSKAGLNKITDINDFYDLDVDKKGKLVCFSQWKDKKRRLVVKELKQAR